MSRASAAGDAAVLAEPTVPVGAGWTVNLSPATLAVFMAFMTPIQVLLPLQLEHIDPHGKNDALSLVTGLGARSSRCLPTLSPAPGRTAPPAGSAAADPGSSAAPQGLSFGSGRARRLVPGAGGSERDATRRHHPRTGPHQR